MINKEKLVIAIAKLWLPLAIIVTALCCLIYFAVQQNYRQSANDPQIQMAEDYAMLLNGNVQPQTIISGAKVDVAKSLSPFVIIYNDTGTPVASNAMLDGAIPTLPSGVFNYVKQHGEDRLTWQPKPGVRSAIVVTSFNGQQAGYVVVGRSLREVEVRENTLGIAVFITWIAALSSTFFAIVLLKVIQWRLSKNP